MKRYVFLDTGPLSLACKRPSDLNAKSCRGWIKGLQDMGRIVIIPEIADYEVRRELLRNRYEDWLDRLNILSSTLPYLPITTAAMRRAAAFWAELRQTGFATAGTKDLDADAILAAQAVSAAQPDDEIIVATTNVGHLERFAGVTARIWSDVH